MKTITSKITLWAAGGMGLMAMSFLGACSKSSNNPPPPPPLIGGYASSDSVASGNLVAYWPFDADANDHKGGLTATAKGSGVTFASKGVRGNAYQGALGGYYTLNVPGGSSLASLQSYSVSVWYKYAGNDTLPRGIFFMSGANTPDELVMEVEPFKPKSGDSVKIHTGFDDIGAPAYQRFIPETFDTMAIGKWVHLVVTYNGGTSTYVVYQNAVPSGTLAAFSNGAYTTSNQFWTDGNKTTFLGNLNFSSDPPKTLVVGSWPDGLFGQVAAKDTWLGQLDELRVYNKALSQTEVSGLFLNGQAGR